VTRTEELDELRLLLFAMACEIFGDDAEATDAGHPSA
jgi:hypothetical protein